MPTYVYICLDATGKKFRGLLEADDERQVSTALWEQGYFLVSTKVYDPTAPETVSPTPSPTEEPAETPMGAEDQPLFLRTEETVRRTFGSRRKVLRILTGCLFLAGLGDYIYLVRFAKTNPFSIGRSVSPVVTKLDHIRPGLTRAEVEKILTEPAPSAGVSNHGRYVLSQGLFVQIHFDNKGGPGSSQNQVVGAPQLEVLPSEMPGLPARRPKEQDVL